MRKNPKSKLQIPKNSKHANDSGTVEQQSVSCKSCSSRRQWLGCGRRILNRLRDDGGLAAGQGFFGNSPLILTLNASKPAKFAKIAV